MLIGAAAAGEQALPCFAVARSQIVVQRVPSDLRQLEPDRPARLSLANVGAVDGVPVGRHVIDAQRDEIAAPQLAVDGEIEQCQVACAPFQLQLGTDQPYVAGPQRRLWTGELALVPGRAIGPWG